MRKIIIGLSLVWTSNAARADQCEALDADTAIAAVHVLREAPVLTFCEPCHEATPTTGPTAKPKSVKPHVSIAQGMQTIAVDGKDVDLAYTYVQTGKYTWTNVGLMLGCGASGVTGFLTLGAPARPHGPPPPPTAGGDLPGMREHVAKLETSARELNERVNKAVDAVVKAQSQSDRDAANARLSALRKEKLALDQDLATAKANLARAERQNGTTIRKECIDNPLAKGC